MDLNANDIGCLTHIFHIKVFGEELFHACKEKFFTTTDRLVYALIHGVFNKTK